MTWFKASQNSTVDIKFIIFHNMWDQEIDSWFSNHQPFIPTLWLDITHRQTHKDTQGQVDWHTYEYILTPPVTWI